MSSSIAEIVAQLTRDAGLLHDVVHGGPANTVRTDFGDRQTLAALEFRAAVYDGRGYATYADLLADLSPAAGTVREVVADADSTRCGRYLKVGSAGSGSWLPSNYDRVTSLQTELRGYLRASTDWAFAIEDAAGRVVAGVDAAGTLHALRWSGQVQGMLPVDAVALADGTELQPTTVPFEVVDSAGRTVLRVTESGVTEVAALRTASGAFGQLDFPGRDVWLAGGRAPGYDVVGTLVLGQSWAEGFDARPPVSVHPRFNSLMFSGGVVAQSSGGETPADYVLFVPLREQAQTGTPGFPAAVLGETPASGQCGAFQERLRAVSQIQVAYDLAQTAELSLAVLAASWTQNTANAGAAAYPALLQQLRADLDEDVRAITGQPEPLKLFTWQYFPDGNVVNTAADLYTRHVQPSIDDPHIYCACPSYFLDPVDLVSNIHLQPASAAWLGAYFGLAMKRVLIDGQDWSPVRPLEARRQGRVLRVRFHVPRGRLVWDTERCALAEHYGFNLYAADGVTELPIESVGIVQRDTVRIVTATPAPDGALLRYCSKGTSYGRLTGIRGNLRDTQGDSIVFDGGGLNLPLHNWCVAFQFPVT